MKCNHRLVENQSLSAGNNFKFSAFNFAFIHSFIFEQLIIFIAPASCRYETKSDFTLLTADYLQFAASATDCMDQCDAETAFNCWAYSYVENRCQLSGDSSVTWGKDAILPGHSGAVYGELRCFFGTF